MAFINNEKFLSKAWFYNYGLILAGSFILGLGFVLFINPYNIVPGGAYGVGIVVHHLIPAIPVGTFGLALNIPLIIVAIKVLGPRFGIKTIVGMVLTSAFMDLQTLVIGEQDPLGLANEILLSCVFGGVTIGLGLGLIFKAKATSAGSDILAMIMAKYTRLPVGQLLIVVDSVIVLLGLIVFQDWKVPLYSWIVIFVTGRVIDGVLEGVNHDKTLFIVSGQHQKIREKIINDLNRGGTYLEGKGMYGQEKRPVIFTVVNRRELAILEDYIHDIDPEAFLTVSNSSEILGNGFKSLKAKVAENQAL
ncbi:MAG: YitT family protein [Bacteroidales bacterium]|nr:YitT family protein [Bacteroidales bacterium]MCF8332729.1 YitT family protein [Bacteroidales bacterium]